jgi:diguanylate cyclase (GGDEF)-like protein
MPPPVSRGLHDRTRLAATAAEHIALALANLNLRETLRHQAVRDPLTGLFNRRYLEETLERELRRAERRSLPLAVIMLDIDHFKRFNDTFGHDAGDALLPEVGSYLRTHVRPEDIACRYGGEEFTLILPDAPLEPTLRRVDELRQGIARLGIAHRGQPLGTVTISMGVAVFPAHGTSPDALLRVADRALYRAKEQGRDCACVASPASGAA